MKLSPIAWFQRDQGETLAVFGDARLVKSLDGRIELRGGSQEDRRAAREWCSLSPNGETHRAKLSSVTEIFPADGSYCVSAVAQTSISSSPSQSVSMSSLVNMGFMRQRG